MTYCRFESKTAKAHSGYTEQPEPEIMTYNASYNVMVRRQRHAVTPEIPACSQNLCRLWMGLPSMVKFDGVFTTGDYEHRAA